MVEQVVERVRFEQEIINENKIDDTNTVSSERQVSQ